MATRKPKSRNRAKKKKSISESEPVLASGPRKERKTGPPEPRHSTHKQRSTWFQARASWPFREADIQNLVTERARTLVPPLPALPQWESMGPTNIGGRCTSLACHPDHPDILWIGAAGGGVWKSTDGGATWAAQWHSQESLNVGALAIDPASPETVYCATGEANLSADSYAGVGIYRTQDGGATWVLWAPAQQMKIPRRIGTIAIDPFDSKHIRIGGVRHSPTDVAGMFVTRDAGATWTMETFVSTTAYFCHSIVFHPARKGILFATVDEQGSRNGIWRSSDGGASWSQLTKGLPAAPKMHRTSLAIARSKPEWIYAVTANSTDGLLGVFRSQNGGSTWKDIRAPHMIREGQMSYGNTIVVHPTNHRWVLCGGVDLHRTTDAGATWARTSQWDAKRGTAKYAHADHHALLMPASAPGRVYDANDGGMDRSDDGGITWKNRSNGLAATMYYDLDVAASDAKSFGGGAQDNGTLVTTTGSADDHFELLGGDGGWMIYNPKDASRIYASFYNFNIFRFRGRQKPKDVSPPGTAADKKIWMCYITPDPATPTTVFTGSTRIWRTNNDGDSWQPVSSDLDGSFISAIEVAPANPSLVYAGTENGGFFRSLDGGDSWSANIASSILPGRIVTRIETHPKDAKKVFVTVAGTGASHVFASNDSGTSWTDIDQGKLPDVPHHAIVIPPDFPASMYVGNDAGVYMTQDNGATWTNASRNLPNTMVVDLVYHRGQSALYAATYGRSIWRVSLK
jgi:photosystem II stability/assembly factor-like uncharacterized protein